MNEEMSFSPNGESSVSAAIFEEDISSKDNLMASVCNDGGEGQHVELGHAEGNPSKDGSIFLKSAVIVESVVSLKNNHESCGHQEINGHGVVASDITFKEAVVDESPIVGVKRARLSIVDRQSSVLIAYKFLTRESKKKLMELMQQWSKWHATCQPSDVSSEDLECGEETYFPALHISSEKSSSVSFWLDNQGTREEIKVCKLDNDFVPLYDRGYTTCSASECSANHGRLEDSRCFNCGSYGHSLKDCPKPRDNVAINNARKQYNSKRNPSSNSRGQVRYYQKAHGKFDDLKAGVLGSETRESLGIGELDPPPWLHRMRELGYPPGYLDVVEDIDEPSGITIVGEDIKTEYEEGELPEAGEPAAPEKRMTVEFPGINAPIPENADWSNWSAQPTELSRSSSFKRRSHSRSNHSLESHRGQHHDWKFPTDWRDDSLSGADFGPGLSTPAYSPRYNIPYDRGSGSAPVSPSFGRSLSDRGWRSPFPYQISPIQSPRSPYPPPPPQPAIESPSYHDSFYRWNPDSVAPFERWKPESSNHHSGGK